METVPQLKHLREQMIEELTQIPQYRALKAMERFISELSGIYEHVPQPNDTESAEFQEKVSQAIENRIKRETAAAGVAPKITPYIPAHRVA